MVTLASGLQLRRTQGTAPAQFGQLVLSSRASDALPMWLTTTLPGQPRMWPHFLLLADDSPTTQSCVLHTEDARGPLNVTACSIWRDGYCFERAPPNTPLGQSCAGEIFSLVNSDGRYGSAALRACPPESWDVNASAGSSASCAYLARSSSSLQSDGLIMVPAYEDAMQLQFTCSECVPMRKHNYAREAIVSAGLIFIAVLPLIVYLLSRIKVVKVTRAQGAVRTLGEARTALARACALLSRLAHRIARHRTHNVVVCERCVAYTVVGRVHQSHHPWVDDDTHGATI